MLEVNKKAHGIPASCAVSCALQWSFLYAEYKPNACFWEFIIMGRKLAFLAATILLPMALDTPEETTAQMQLLVCVLLAVTFLLLHASLHPFKRGVLNRLERLGLTAIALR
jgi:phosphatidylserine synthase